jgi:dGTPase
MQNPKLEVIAAPLKYLRRVYAEEWAPEPARTECERDRDRILYSKAFRRLSGKTQVFMPRHTDHLRTRLTHTLEVAQISRTIARNLGLNEILTEAIALGHDLGHTPFGHVGEETLNQLLNNCEKMGEFQDDMEPSDKGFKHNYQALRVLTDKENIYRMQGLNISNFTLWGILNHTKRAWKTCPYFQAGSAKSCFLLRNPKTCAVHGRLEVEFYKKYVSSVKEGDHESWSFEGMSVATADEIAQRAHDTEDAVAMDIVSTQTILELIRELFGPLCRSHTRRDAMLRKILRGAERAENQKVFLSYMSKFIVELYTGQTVATALESLTKFSKHHVLKHPSDFTAIYPSLEAKHVLPLMQWNRDFQDANDKFHTFLRNRLINSHTVQEMDGWGRFVLRSLVKAYLSNPRQLFDATVLWTFKEYDPDRFGGLRLNDKEAIGELRDQIDTAAMRQEGAKFQIALLRAMCDYISGMTDDFAIRQYHKLFG